MSQKSLLEEVCRWNEQMCKRKMGPVLSELISIYQRSDSSSEQLRILKMLTDKFLPHISLAEIEQNFFSPVLPRAMTLFNELANELSQQAGGLSSQNTELQAALRNTIQSQVQLLEVLMNLVHHVCALEETLALASIHSLSLAVFHVLKNAFSHCKDSETLYSGRLHLVADVLQSLFKEAYSLQKVFMELLDRIVLESAAATDEDITCMVRVVRSVLEICSVISKMDHALHANTWKFLIKISVRHRVLLETKLPHDELVAGLCEDILYSFNSCLQLAEQMNQPAGMGSVNTTDYKLFQKTMKLCRFFANTLVHYVKEFIDFLSKSCHLLHQLYLQMYSKFPPSLYAPVLSDGPRDQITSVVPVALDALVSQLLSFRPFVEIVLIDNLDFCSELALPQCLLLINVMGKLPLQPWEVQSLWCSGSQFSEEKPRLPLFHVLFLNFQRCSAELSLPVHLPGVMSKGQAQQSVSLYEYVCTHLCSFITSLPASLFPKLECTLLDAVLSPHMLTALLATDAWCFLARYGSAELCARHVSLVAQLVKSCCGECYQLSHLSLLLRRMLFLMAADHQVAFVEKFTPKETSNLLLWRQVSIKALTPELQKPVTSDITRTAIDRCLRWKSSKRALGELEQVNVALAAVVAVCQAHGEALSSELQLSITETLSQMWTVLTVEQVLSQRCVQQTIAMLLSLVALLIRVVGTTLIAQVVLFLSSLLPLNPPDHVRLAALDFLGSLGKIVIPPDVQGIVLPQLPCLFASLLADKSWLILQHALQGFTLFAEETCHEEVVPHSLESGDTKSKVVSFLNKVISTVECKELQVERLKRENTILDEHFTRLSLCAVTDPVVVQPSAKRARQEPCEEEEYESALQTAENAFQTLQTLLQQGPAPEWIMARLQALQTLIIALNTGRQ
ncbi:FIGNL1-interacting regulator of recombination and mitosis isoform X2 [Heterodontus francisci]|uniref:FIGNL1-interacting regulator of recombination and mitosis isoform X2 n=1 Tax=Heterodontus francisci TaxID=7792 RepID=UPI00355B326D